MAKIWLLESNDESSETGLIRLAASSQKEGLVNLCLQKASFWREQTRASGRSCRAERQGDRRCKMILGVALGPSRVPYHLACSGRSPATKGGNLHSTLCLLVASSHRSEGPLEEYGPENQPGGAPPLEIAETTAENSAPSLTPEDPERV